MPPGAKKRKALKKKQQQQQQQESNNKASNGDKLNDDRESDDSSLSSPASQGNGEFGGTKDPSGLVKDTVKGLGTNNGIAIALERATDDKKNIVDLASQDSACGYSIPEKREHAEKEYPSPEKDSGKVATLPGSATGTSRKVESLRETEAPVSSEEKRLLLTGPPAVRTSWLSCCGLFDAVTGSDR